MHYPNFLSSSSDLKQPRSQVWTLRPRSIPPSMQVSRVLCRMWIIYKFQRPNFFKNKYGRERYLVLSTGIFLFVRTFYTLDDI